MWLAEDSSFIYCDSSHPTYLETICVHTNVAQISIVFQPLAAAEGYVPDSYVTSDLVTTGRPAPSMIYLNMVLFKSSLLFSLISQAR